LFLSGLTSRRPDGTIAGVSVNSDGSLTLDVAEQTSAVLQSIEAIIKQATNNKGGLGNVIDATIFLTDLKNDYAGMNEVWNKTWTSAQMAPARTCVGVSELPSPKFAVEFKVTALVGDD
jgi:2-aminomuconate deaminase